MGMIHSATADVSLGGIFQKGNNLRGIFTPGVAGGTPFLNCLVVTDVEVRRILGCRVWDSTPCLRRLVNLAHVKLEARVFAPRVSDMAEIDCLLG